MKKALSLLRQTYAKVVCVELPGEGVAVVEQEVPAVDPDAPPDGQVLGVVEAVVLQPRGHLPCSLDRSFVNQQGLSCPSRASGANHV